MNIIVTGASRGIGYAVVRAFCLMGDHRIVAISRDHSGLVKLADECIEINSCSEVMPVVLDITDENMLKESAGQIVSELKQVDILINNAGKLIRKDFEDISTEEAHSVFEVNYFAAASVIRNFIPGLVRSPNSHVVNISSMAGYPGSKKFSGLSVYSASKAAIAALTESLAEEFKARNISFNCLALGSVQTEMLAEAFPGLKAPLDPSEMADYIADFALSAHNYLNGKVIPVNLSTP